MNEFCRKCGCAVPLARRKSQDNRDDISPGNLERLKGKSRKVDTGQVVTSELKIYRPILEDEEMYPRQTYKDFEYRAGIAARYGIYLTINERNFLEPHLMTGGPDDWPMQAAASMPAP
jgi:hypothetical protein